MNPPAKLATLSAAVSGRGATKSLPAPLLATYVAIALVGIVPLLVVAATDSASALEAWPFAVVSTSIAGARFAWVVGSASRRVFELTTWLFFYIFMGLAPLAQLRLAIDPGTTPYLDHSHDGTALGIVIVAEVALIVGSTFGKRRRDVIPAEPRRQVSESRTRWWALILTALAVAYIGLIGVSAIFASRTERGTALAAAFGDEAVRTLVTGFVTVGLLTVVIAQMEIRRRRVLEGRKASWIPILLSVVPLLAIVNPLASARFILVTVLLALLAGAGFYASVRAFRATAVGAIAAMLLLFPILDSFRFEVGAVQSVSPVEALASGDFDAFAQTINSAWSVAEFGPTLGFQMLGVLLFWVPRSLWPGKPVDTGILLAEQKGYYFTNLSAPLPAELFINFGWPALIVGMVALGVVLRRADDSSERNMQFHGAPTILGCVLPPYLIFLYRGSLLQAFANLAVILLVWWLCTKRTAGTPADGRGSRKRSRSVGRPRY